MFRQAGRAPPTPTHLCPSLTRFWPVCKGGGSFTLAVGAAVHLLIYLAIYLMSLPAEKIGRYSATTITQIINPTKTIISGSMIVDINDGGEFLLVIAGVLRSGYGIPQNKRSR